MKKYIVLFFIAFFLRCNVDSTTTNPSNTDDLALSNKGGLEIAEFAESSETDKIEVTIDESGLTKKEIYIAMPYLLVTEDKASMPVNQFTINAIATVDGAPLGGTTEKTTTTDGTTQTSTFKNTIALERNVNHSIDTKIANIEKLLTKKSKKSRISSKLAIAKNEKRTFKFSRDGDTIEATITAYAKNVGDKAIFFVDETSIDIDDITQDTAFTEMLDALEDIALPRMDLFYGTCMDENAMFIPDGDMIDNKTNIVFTSILNDSNQLGFFNAGDLLEYDAVLNPTSNEQKILYMPIPSSSVSKDKILASLVHNYQHLLNFCYKVVRPFISSNDQNVTREATWLDEAMSQLAEDIVGYGNYNYILVSKFLSSPSAVTLFSSLDSEKQRTFGYLFLRYLIEREGQLTYSDETANTISGDPIELLNALIASRLHGLENIETNQDQKIDFLFPRFLATLALDSTNLNENYRFDDTQEDKLTGHIRGIRLAQNERTIDGAATPINGLTSIDFPTASEITLKPSATNFYKLTPDANQFEIKLTADQFFHDTVPITLGLVIVRVEDTAEETTESGL